MKKNRNINMNTFNLKINFLSLICFILTATYSFAQQGNVTVNQDKHIAVLLDLKKEEIHPNFKPSAISIHPNGNIYILSSFSKTILVLNKNGDIKNKTQLNSYIYHQPEGICFDSKGNLIIANEKYKTYPTLIKLDKKVK